MTTTDGKGSGAGRLRRFLVAAVALGALVAGAGVQGHGSVVDEADLCVIQIGFYRAHFTMFQPTSRGHREYCEDLPDAGETVFVMDFLHPSLSDVPLEFRVVRDRNGVGRFARYEDVAALDLERDTVLYVPPSVHRETVYMVLHDFERGDYIGVVTAGHPTLDEEYRAVFPFQVGRIPWERTLWLPVPLLLVGWWIWWRRAAARTRTAAGSAWAPGTP